MCIALFIIVVIIVVIILNSALMSLIPTIGVPDGVIVTLIIVSTK